MVLYHLQKYTILQSRYKSRFSKKRCTSVNLNIEHDDFEEWLEIREPKGDVNRQSLNLHQCAIVGDKFMRKLQDGNDNARRRWGKLLQKEK